jgi:hypothetical protein
MVSVAMKFLYLIYMTDTSAELDARSLVTLGTRLT